MKSSEWKLDHINSVNKGLISNLVKLDEVESVMGTLQHY